MVSVEVDAADYACRRVANQSLPWQSWPDSALPEGQVCAAPSSKQIYPHLLLTRHSTVAPKDQQQAREEPRRDRGEIAPSFAPCNADCNSSAIGLALEEAVVLAADLLKMAAEQPMMAAHLPKMAADLTTAAPLMNPLMMAADPPLMMAESSDP